MPASLSFTEPTEAAAADGLARAIDGLLDDLFSGTAPISVRLWNGTLIGAKDSPGCAVIHSPEAFRRILFTPSFLGVARALAAGEISLEGDIIESLDAVWKADPTSKNLRTRAVAKVIASVPGSGILGPPIPPPAEEAPSSRRRHSKFADAASISHHYDIGNDFYELVLGETMAYTCARYETDDMSLQDAQRSKFDLICRKLDLKAGQRGLDIGCGWGSFSIHAAKHYGAKMVAFTVSKEQAAWAVDAVKREGVDNLVEVRCSDYREAVREGETFDAIAAIGILEHVGEANTLGFFESYTKHLVEGGRFLNHCITKAGGGKINQFIDRYVFPDGELQDIGSISVMFQQAGLELRDIESLREHYDKTCEAWVRNLEANWDEAVKCVGRNRAEIWRLYMAGSSVSFRNNRIGLHQLLGVKTTSQGVSGMPLTRKSYI